MRLFGFAFAGKETDLETGLSYFGARYYDSELLTGWLSIDPMSDKYPSLSPYNYCANNPVKLIDPNGMSLKIPDKETPDHTQSKADIVNLVNKKNRNRVIVTDDGSISIDLSGLSGKAITKMFKKDKGIALLDELILSDKEFYYECSDYQTLNENSKQSIEDDPNGVVNASDGGLDSMDGYACVPRKGYNGHVVLAKSGHWYNKNRSTGRLEQKISIKRSILYHELKENYYRTECGYDYNGNSSNNNQGAHSRAVRDEGVTFGNTHPGKFEIYEFL